MTVNFLVPVNIYAYSFKVATYIDGIARYIQSWSVFDSNSVAIDQHTNDQTFASTEYKAFTLSKRIITKFLKIQFYKSAYHNLAYIYYFDVFGHIVPKPTKKRRRFCSFQYIYVM